MLLHHHAAPLHSTSCRGLVCVLTGPVSTWKWYKSTVVQEAFAISSLLRHKRITVPLTQTTTTWDPVQRWNFPTDKNTLTVPSLELTGWSGRAVAVILQWMSLFLAAPVVLMEQIKNSVCLFYFITWITFGCSLSIFYFQGCSGLCPPLTCQIFSVSLLCGASFHLFYVSSVRSCSMPTF